MSSEVFKTLSTVDVGNHTEKKNGLTYLSWCWAWAEIMKKYPDATYEIKNFDGRPYLYDENLGYLVMTSMVIDGMERTMWLPVMDGANKAMKAERYTYPVKKYENGKWTGEYTEKPVEPATMFDVNTAIMRCLVKNIAMYGLGLYIYAGEDLPPAKDASKTKIDKIAKLCEEMDVNIVMLYRKYGVEYGDGLKDNVADVMIKVLESAKEKKKDNNAHDHGNTKDKAD